MNKEQVIQLVEETKDTNTVTLVTLESQALLIIISKGRLIPNIMGLLPMMMEDLGAGKDLFSDQDDWGVIPSSSLTDSNDYNLISAYNL